MEFGDAGLTEVEDLATDQLPKRQASLPASEIFEVVSDRPGISIFDGILVGLFGGAAAGLIIGGVSDADGLGIAFDTEIAALVGILIGILVALIVALGRRFLPALRPSRP